MEGHLAALETRGFTWLRGQFPDSDQAFDAADRLIAGRCAGEGSAALAVIGDFVLPPLEGPQSRDFQTLHFDFGLPLEPKVEQDVARYTALHIPSDHTSVTAVTRLVPLAALLKQQAWPSPGELLDRLIAYGETHGAWDDAAGYTEGSLARVIEAAVSSPALPSVKLHPEFLCGLEFDNLDSELAFFARHGLQIEAVELEVALQPGELLVFDNLSLAHGRRGCRRPGELRQRVYGHRRFSPAAQRELRDLALGAFMSPSRS